MGCDPNETAVSVPIVPIGPIEWDQIPPSRCPRRTASANLAVTKGSHGHTHSSQSLLYWTLARWQGRGTWLPNVSYRLSRKGTDETARVMGKTLSRSVAGSSFSSSTGFKLRYALGASF